MKALFIRLLVVVALVAGCLSAVVVASPRLGIARADVPSSSAPTTISLVANEATFAAGSSFTLTASTDVDVSLSSSQVTITDQATNTTVQTCSTGTSCVLTTTFYTGGPHTYTAQVNSLVSAPVTVARQSWTVTLGQVGTGYPAGSPTTLTATANQNVGSTGNVYQIEIFDETTGALAASCLTGTTCSVTPVFYTGGPHTYLAEVAGNGTSSYSHVIDQQATSNEITITRQAWTVSLTESGSVYTAGSPITLTATANQNVGGTGNAYQIYIFDETTGALATSCASGTACSVTPVFYTSAHTYLAEVAGNGTSSYSHVLDQQATSNEITITRQAWTVSLTESGSVYTAGSPITLTATVNQNLSNTGNAYRIYIFDETTGALVNYCYTGTTCAVTPVVYSGAPHTYVAEVAASGTPTYGTATDIQATSNEITIARQAWTVSLTESGSVYTAGSPLTLTATANQNVGNTGNAYRIYIFDDTTGALVNYCYTGTTCTAIPVFYTGGPHTYVAEVAASGTPTYGTATDVQATSNQIAITRQAWTVSLTESGSVYTAGSPITLTATANQNVGNTGNAYQIEIFDETTGALAASCASGTTCTATPVFYTGGPHTYLAEVAGNGTSSYSHVLDQQATSNEIVINRRPWTISLTESGSVYTAGSPITLTATANQNVGNTGNAYQIEIFDETTGALAASCASGTTCTATPVFYTGGPHTYLAEVAGNGTSSYSHVLDQQATSNEIVINRRPWTISLQTSVSAVGPSTSFTLTATANQNVGNTGNAYRIYLLDYTANTVISSCLSGTTCTTTTTSPVGTFHTYVAMVASAANTTQMADVQAISNGFSAPNAGGAALPGETTGGSNSAESLCQCSHADPIDTATGEFYLPSTDIGIGGFGPALAVGRTYSSSAAAADGPFGFGWIASFSMALRILAPGDTTDPLPRQVQVVQENGATVVFSEDASQHYTAPERVHATLSLNVATQKWLFVRNAKQQITFNSNGSLDSLSDLHGNTIGFSYNGAGQLTTMTARGSRSLTFTWSGTHIGAVQDSAGRTVQYGYDSADNLTAVTMVDGSQAHYGYDSGHYLTREVRPAGGVTTNVYDSQHRVVSQTDPLGRVTSFSYNGSTTVTTAPDGSQTSETYSSGQLVTLTKAAGTPTAATTTYTYDTANDLASVTDPTGAVTSYTYDATGNRTSQTAPLGRTTIWTYDALNDQTSAADPLGRLTSRTFDAQGDLLTSTSPGEHHQQWTYNADGTAASATNPASGTSRYTYDDAGNVLSTTDPDGRVTVLGYDTAGRVVTITDSASHASRLSYDPAGRLLTSTDAAGYLTQYAYDADGNQLRITSPAGRIRSTAYDAADQIVSKTDATGGTTGYTYTPTGKVAAVTNPDHHTTTYSYDARGNVSSETDADSRVTSYGYDLDDRPLTVTLPSGAVTSTSYDAAGERISSTDAGGATTLYRYDADGELTTTTDPLSRVTSRGYTPDGQVANVINPDASSTSYSYYPAGQVASVTDPDGHVTSYQYDPAGLLVSATEPGDLTTHYAYNAAGNLSVLTRPDGSTISRVYDADGQITGTSYSNTQTSAVSYSYDSDGERTAMTDGTGTTSYSYDGAGRLTSTTNGAGATLGYSYGASGQLDAITYPGAHTVRYSYDAADQMTAVTDWNDNATHFSWTADGELLTQSDPNGVSATTSYDANGQDTGIVVSRSTDTLATLGYQYDAAGQLSHDAGITGDQHGYTFTPNAQLNQVSTTHQDGSTTTGSYTVSSGGQLTGLPDGTSQQYNAAGQLSSVVTPAAVQTDYSYDDNGERTTATTVGGTQPTVSYGYNGAGALSTAQVASQPDVTYGIDGDGLRQSRSVGTTTRQFTWDTSGDLPMLLDDGDHSYLYGPSNTPIAQVDDASGTIQYLHGDQLGSTALITDASGSVVATSAYDAYGNRTLHTGTADSAIGYTGEWTDPTTRLVYLRARDYDPTTGQFLTIDPLVAETDQPYAYVADNPLQFTDPTGQCLFGRSNGRCRGGGVMDSALTSGPSNWLATQLQTGAIGDTVTVFEGIGDGATFGLTQQVRDSIDPGSECFVNHNGFYFGGTVVGVAASAILTDGASTEALSAEGAEAEASGAAEAAEDLATSCANSFTADTPVTLANGRKKPIKDVQVGDKVLATDPQTGKTKAEPVVALIRHSGEHAMVLVALADGSVLDATGGHKIWDATRATFVDAEQLAVGDKIETDTGQLIVIAGLTSYSADLTAYNLQVDQIHTYYAGTTPVLVHNSCTSSISDDPYLVKAAEKAASNSSVQREIDSLTSQLSAGNLNPGIGSKALPGTGLSYARGANGARVFFRIVDGGVQIVAKASKANESGVISRLLSMYGG